MKTMKAIRIHGYGGPEVLVSEEVPLPQPGAAEALIRVHAAGVNPLDWKVRAGYLKDWLNHKFPLIPGWDVSGVVETVGAEVTEVRPGEAVFGMLDFSRDGAYAEYTVARARDLARKPDSLDHVYAASVPLAALTAWQALFDVAGLTDGQTVLIHGGAGGVGHFAVQFANWRKARVVATASGRNVGFVRELGAAEVIDYGTTRFDEVVRDVDVVLDTLGGDVQERSWKVLRKGGILVSTLGISSPDAGREFGVRAEGVGVRPDAGELARIAALIDARKVRPVIGVVVPLAEAAKAHELSQSGHARGKIVLKVRD